MTETADRFRRNYTVPFLQYLDQRSESALRAAYELGRAAMVERLGLLDLAQIHHAVFLDALRGTRSRDELEEVASAACAFFTEVLATFEMAQRGFVETSRAGVERREPPARREP